MRIETFSTERLPPSDSLRAWHVAFRQLDHGLMVKPRGAELFRGSLRSYVSPRHKFLEFAMSPHVGVYRPTIEPGVWSKPYLMTLLNEGATWISQDGREAQLAAGDAVLVDRARPFHIESAATRAVEIDIPASALRAVLPQVEGLTAVQISGRLPAGQLLKAIVDELFRSSADGRAADHFADAIPHLLAAALADLPAARKVVPGRTETYHRQRVLEFVNQRLQDNDLSPPMIAQALDLSVRYVHKLFAGGTETVMRHVWNKRLERCRDELAIAVLAQRSIGEIAYRWGFHNPTHFSRAFTVRFGQSPRAFRRQALADRQLENAGAGLPLD